MVTIRRLKGRSHPRGTTRSLRAVPRSMVDTVSRIRARRAVYINRLAEPVGRDGAYVLRSTRQKRGDSRSNICRWPSGLGYGQLQMDPLSALGPQFQKPPPEFGLCPFWFWNDHLDESEIVRQMREFRSHGVNAFVLHPRVGLPQEIGWMSERMLHFVRRAVVQAEQLGMGVVLYDEGMYPSGSSSGQVVAQAPQFACRGLIRRPADASPEHPDEQVLEVADGWCVVDRPIRSTIRGLHYIADGPEEESPAARA